MHSNRQSTLACELRGTGRPILMLHGFCVDRRSMIGCMEPVFAQRPGWQRVYVDLPGMGGTPAGAHVASADAMREAILAFIGERFQGQRLLIAAKSYGGYLTRGVLAERAAMIDGVALICPVMVAEAARRHLPEHRVIAQDRALLSELDRADMDDFTPYFTVQDRRTWERFRDEILPGVRAADMRALARLRQHYSFAHEAAAQPFTKPALIVTGRQDGDVGYQDTWDHLEEFPRATFAVLDRASHNAEIEQDRLFEALVHEWLDRVEEATPS